MNEEEEKTLIQIKFVIDMYNLGLVPMNNAMEEVLELVDRYVKEVAE